jgi:hypothetical protein
MFYAFEHYYGVGTTDENGSRIGHIKFFDTKHARDAWVDADVWDGNYDREPMTRPEALRVMRADGEYMDEVRSAPYGGYHSDLAELSDYRAWCENRERQCY